MGLAASPSPTPDCSLAWRLVDTPNGDPFPVAFGGVAAVSANEVWAVGDALRYGYPYYTDNPLTERWDGSSWQIIPAPSRNLNDVLAGVAAVRSDNIWAVGSETSPYNTLIEHWDGANWSLVDSPNPPPHAEAALHHVTVLSDTDAWAVGYYVTATGIIGFRNTLIEHWDGTAWQIVPSPNVGSDDNDLWGVFAISINDVWAVGQYFDDESGHYHALTIHWDGTQWRIVSSPPFDGSNSYLYGVAAITANDMWAVGVYYTNSVGSALILHWDGNNWQQVDNPNPYNTLNELHGIVALSAADIWAVGYGGDSGGVGSTLVKHWDGMSWQVVPSPNLAIQLNPLFSVVAVRPYDIWAVGYAYPSIPGTLALHYSVPNGCPTLTPTATPLPTTTPSPSPTPCASQYRDVGVEYWAYGYIHYLACRGVTAGYPDGSFRPATPISRAEYSKLLALAYGLPLTSPPTPRFSDVPPNHWAYGYIEALAAANISVGYPDGTYRPNLSISRAELVKLTVLASGAPPYTGPFTDYPDVPPSHWAYQYIKTATHRGWVGGYADGNFRPSATSSRAELAKLLYLALTFPRGS